ncbi:MAG: hypothetical protein COT74_12375 [Bdellovibrionales bacterium CG10_big_fil_rev_8_21_14_0_10_45_34]|nr:MAG: hypothetical protein COT74_12375 [Bdellovibrionales bacterium CG10_big_fil_rev_8_21_14_0_10_45_34]
MNSGFPLRNSVALVISLSAINSLGVSREYTNDEREIEILSVRETKNLSYNRIDLTSQKGDQISKVFGIEEPVHGKTNWVLRRFRQYEHWKSFPNNSNRNRIEQLNNRGNALAASYLKNRSIVRGRFESYIGVETSDRLRLAFKEWQDTRESILRATESHHRTEYSERASSKSKLESLLYSLADLKDAIRREYSRNLEIAKEEPSKPIHFMDNFIKVPVEWIQKFVARRNVSELPKVSRLFDEELRRLCLETLQLKSDFIKQAQQEEAYAIELAALSDSKGGAPSKVTSNAHEKKSYKRSSLGVYSQLYIYGEVYCWPTWLDHALR